MGKRILIVDDDVSEAEAAATILTASGLYEVATEHDAERALFVARRFKPHVMLLNIDMAGRKGGEVALLMVSDSFLRHVPILFVTAPLGGDGDTHRPGQCRGGGVLMKPFQADVLLDRVGRAIGRAD